jgi:hypothetical protein
VVALTLGSLGPDLEYLVSAVPRAPGALHKPLGALALGLPLLLLVTIVRHAAGPALLAHLGRPLPRLPFTLATVLRATVSIALGLVSHLLLDLVVRDTHFSVALRLADAAHTPAAFELVVTAVLSVVTLAALLHALARGRRALRTLKLVPLAAFTLVGLLGAIIALARCLFVLREPTLYFHSAKLYASGYALFHASAGAGLALLATGTALALATHNPRGGTP